MVGIHSGLMLLRVNDEPVVGTMPFDAIIHLISNKRLPPPPTDVGGLDRVDHLFGCAARATVHLISHKRVPLSPGFRGPLGPAFP